MKHNLALKQTVPQVGLEYGEVLREGDGVYLVATSHGPMHAVQAAGCLLRPSAGDTVLVSVNGQGVSFVLTVLEQAPGRAQSDIVLNGCVRMHVRDGDLNIVADRSLGFSAATELDLAAESLGVHAASGKVNIERLSVSGAFVRCQIKAIKYVGKTIETICSRLTQRVRNAVRYVQEHEEIQSNSTRYLVEETITVHAKNAVHVAEEIVKIDAEQVHLG